MEPSGAVKALSGFIFVVSGLALIFNLKLLPPLDPKTVVGLALIAAGVAIALKASPGAAFVLALSLIVLAFSLSEGPQLSFVHSKVSFSGKLSCSEFKLKSVMSSTSLETGVEGFYEGTGPSNVSAGCDMSFCCSKVRIGLKDPKVLVLKNVQGSLSSTVRNCVRELELKNELGSASLVYYVPENCSSAVSLKVDMGSTSVKLIVPKGVKVVYEVHANLGSASVRTPQGSTSSGTFGEGENVVTVRGVSNMGSLSVVIEEK